MQFSDNALSGDAGSENAVLKGEKVKTLTLKPKLQKYFAIEEQDRNTEDLL
ncbi:MAG: hypothetical protein AAGG51_09695 [Cyanobacteria bacterium P01_G01_bin.54]